MGQPEILEYIKNEYEIDKDRFISINEIYRYFCKRGQCGNKVTIYIQVLQLLHFGYLEQRIINPKKDKRIQGFRYKNEVKQDG